MAQKRTIKLLKREAFPEHTFMKHLEDGTRYYQERDFERASEEWGAASRTHPPAFELPLANGKIACGVRLEETPLMFLLQAAYANRMDGLGVIQSKIGARKIMFNRGKIVRAGSTGLEERIGKFIVQKRNMSEKELVGFLDQAKRAGKRIGDYLVEIGYMNKTDLREILSLQFEEIMGHVLSWKNGVFYIYEARVPQEAGVSYTPLQFAMAVTQRAVRFSDFRNRIPHNKIIFRPSPYVEDNPEESMRQLNLNEQYIFSLINGARNIDQLIRFSGMDEIDVISILYKLSILGLIRKTREVIEYEDLEYNEVIQTMDALFDVYRMITGELFHELGLMGEKAIEKARGNLSPEDFAIFRGMDLTNPDTLDSASILRNLANSYPLPEQRPIFIRAFHTLFQNILEELKRFLGVGLRRATIEEIRKKRSDIERFAGESQMKQDLMKVLNAII